MVNENLMKKIRYLLSFKFNSDEEPKYIPLLEKVFYDFIVSMEENYNFDSNKNTYYNLLLNKLNHHIKSIIIPSDTFYYHPLGFLELSTNLSDKTDKYELANVSLSRNLKEEIFKINYFYQLLLVIKTTKTHIGICSTSSSDIDKYNFIIGADYFGEDKNSIMEKVFTEVEALELTDCKKLYKNKYKVMYPDATTHTFFMYLKNLDFKYLEVVNMLKILEGVIGKTYLIDAEINDFKKFINEFNDKYDNLLGNLRFDINNENKRVQTYWNLISDLVYAIVNEKSSYRKIEYLKVLNYRLFKLYDKKIDEIVKDNLNKDDVLILQKEIKILEENMIYDEDYKLHKQMKHVELLNNIKKKINKFVFDDKNIFELKEYKISNSNRNKIREVKASFQPIKVNNTYVIINVLDNINLENKVFLKFSAEIYDFNTGLSKKYDNLSLLIDQIKYLYTSFELGVITKESDSVRIALAVRLINSDIMDIINNSRYGFVGEFVYSNFDKRCIIYKNGNIIEYLKKKSK